MKAIPTCTPPVLSLFLSCRVTDFGQRDTCFQLFIIERSLNLLRSNVFHLPHFSNARVTRHIITMFSAERETETDWNYLVNCCCLVLEQVHATYNSKQMLLHNGVFVNQVCERELFGRIRHQMQETRDPWQSDHLFRITDKLNALNYNVE